jgi:diaminohydroxyphosphoribosylaminopyrimidine deaminase/5-amino-6-(5-phosphoribosylamino)uracil reductase
MKPNQPKETLWMKRALALAEKGAGRTSPNPLVGALVVQKGNVVGEGFHAYFGGPHAEVAALRKAGARAKGATLYVTLEPCSTWGKTPPCVDPMIESGVSRVVVGSLDPNPKNRRSGIRRLREAGISVQVGLLKEEVEKQNRSFFKRMKSGLPYVVLKMAQSLDGKIATRTGESRWISSPPARRLVHRLRAEADAVLVGKKTALQDNPRLQAEQDGEKPWRVVLDPKMELSPKARCFQGSQLTFLAVSEKTLRGISAKRSSARRTVLPIPEREGKLALKPLLRTLAALGVNHLLVEGGGEVAWSFLREGLVDELIWIVAPKIVGGRSAKTSVEGEGIAKLSTAFPLQWEKVYPLGDDWVFVARPVRN